MRTATRIKRLERDYAETERGGVRYVVSGRIEGDPDLAEPLAPMTIEDWERAYCHLQDG